MDAAADVGDGGADQADAVVADASDADAGPPVQIQATTAVLRIDSVIVSVK